MARALVPLTYAELATLTDDLPAGLTPVAPPPQDSLAKAGVYVTLVAGLFLVAAISNGSGNPLTLLGSVLFLSPVWLLALAGLLALHARLDRRAAGRLPPGPGQGADGAPGQGHAGTGDDPRATRRPRRPAVRRSCALRSQGETRRTVRVVMS